MIETMRIIFKAPCCPPAVMKIPNTLKALQASVGGYIETVTLSSDTVLICNEEGIIRGLPYNLKFLGGNYCGAILIAGIDGDEFTSLSDEQIDSWMDALKRAWMSTEEDV